MFRLGFLMTSLSIIYTFNKKHSLLRLNQGHHNRQCKPFFGKSLFGHEDPDACRVYGGVHVVRGLNNIQADFDRLNLHRSRYFVRLFFDFSKTFSELMFFNQISVKSKKTIANLAQVIIF